MIKLIIARHGNTFNPGEEPRRVGRKTDIPLSESGKAQAQKLGEWLTAHHYKPEAVYSSQLKRTIETAEIATGQKPFQIAMFNEVDYGPDENTGEEATIARIGQNAMDDWNEKGIVPPGWNFDAAQCITDWKQFANGILKDERSTHMVVTSNGIARFAPHITGDFEGFARTHPLKMSTGAVSVFVHEDGKWTLKEWNAKP